MSHNELVSAGLNCFPDGCSGIRYDANEQTTHFWAANGGNTAHLVGTLDSPSLYSVATSIPLQDPKSDYNYAAGGVVYTDPNSGMILLFFHVERHPTGAQSFLSSLGLAYSNDGGEVFTDLGEYVLSKVSRTDAAAAGMTIEMGGGTPIIKEDYFYCYFADYPRVNGRFSLAVARARVEDVVAAAAVGELAPWYKYFNGNWGEPGNIDGDRGGDFTPLSSALAWWPNASYNAYLGKVIVISPASSLVGGTVLRISISNDGINFSSPEILLDGIGNEVFYPTIIPNESDLAASEDPLVTNDQFWVYYINSATGGWNRWQDANWVRRSIAPLE